MMMKVVSFSALLVAVFAGCALAAPLSFDNLKKTSYIAEAVISLPYAAISEPVKVYYDAGAGRSRVEYYHGMDVYVMREDVGKHGYQFQINPVTDNERTNVMTCFGINGTKDDPITVQSLIPDLSKYEKATNPVMYRGLFCDLYTYSYLVGAKSNTYSFYVNRATGLPVGFEMRGYDDLLGSHYDEYDIYFYDFIVTVPSNISLYEPPKGMSCGDFPGPGVAVHHHRGGLHMHEDYEAAEKEVGAAFDSFKAQHGRMYETEQEHAKRLNNFRHNKKFVDAMNRRNLTYTLALNHLADLHDEERAQMRGTFSSRTDYAYVAETPSPVRSAARDWRTTGAVTGVKDQGICGSCWSFGAAQAIEGQYFLATNRTVPMSQQALMDCSWGFGNNACDGGEAFRAYEWVLQNGYIPTEASYGPYLMADGYCHPEKADKGPGIKGYVNITSGDMNKVLDMLDNDGPLAVAIDASLKSFSFYSSGVYYDSDCGNTPDDLDHAVLAVGFGTSVDGEDYWIIKNSWSTNYGDRGYVRMSRRNNNCGVATDAHIPLL
ncbi:hypothetical protein PTSG_07816 [Salpingoeca rosetta]|uniref:Counting factor associated protein D n=1 Tax=Salpingoeca rosetta (strain ATCC 50818 / BSB-021) TaxID=946362 RepID=F2UGE9_SALR5|nr:uncharacterized protein PTSG_07816 [Salpingoeca rosetta]EGD75699.1 hypothetical protein PTSG_07816 [Salpingoeca rosetta]|eukprot:XP_004991620.1 hypothetical protein PTSG_07816 [Salpingoeca rosetta]